MSKIIELNSDIWITEVTSKKGPVVVDFWHHMCGWCLKLNPVYEQLPKHFESVRFAKMNILESPENRKIAIENGVMGTPTIKVYCDGREIGEIVGYRSFEGLVKELKEIINKKEDCLEKSTPLDD
jgi:thioredoxin 1